MEKLARRDPQSLALARLDSRALPQYLTREQVVSLVGACRNEHDKLFVRVAFETGGRVTELVELRRSDVDLTNRQIRLRTLKRRTDRRRNRVEVFRWIPVSHSLCADLANFFLQESTYHLDFREGIERARVFGITRKGAYAMVRKAGRRAGLLARGGREVSPHILRHSFAMHCLTHGVPITVVKELLGHAAISSTMVYSKTDPVQAREFLSRVQF